MRRRWWQRTAVVTALAAAALAVAGPAGASTRTVRIAGVQTAVAECGGKTSLFTAAVEGDLTGCWYTLDIAGARYDPSTGVYREQGRERFEGCLVRSGEDPVCGAFEQEYRIMSRFEPGPEPGRLVTGGCRHPIVPGSGEGGFTGVAGFMQVFEQPDNPAYPWTGHLTFPRA